MDIATLEKVEAVGSKLEKVRLLKTVDAETIKMLKWALDPMITFGATVDEAQQVSNREMQVAIGKSWGEDHYWKLFDGLCKQLCARHKTGNAAAESINAVLSGAPSERHVIWSCRILNKDLDAGFSISTLNKAHPGTLEPFAVALATPYDPDKHEIRGAWCVEPKLDGLRMVVMDGVAYTRNGRVIESVGHILEELKPFAKDYVFDGEIMGETEFNEDSGKIRKKGMGPNLTLKYNVFDCIWKAEWDTRKTQPYIDRRRYLTEALGTAAPKYTNIVKSRRLPVNPTSEDLFKFRDEFIADGYEGAMLKDMSSPYIFKRSDAILKLKEGHDADGVITGYYIGKKKNKDKLGGFETEFDGVCTNVGGGFSDEQREEFWKKRDSLVGRVIEVEYQNKQPGGKLRNPVFVRFRPDKD